MITQTTRHPTMDARTAVRLAGGIIRGAELIAHVGRSEFNRALGEKEIKRQSRGLYAAGTPTTEQLKARELRGTVSHLTAAWHWNIGITVRPVRWDVTVPSSSYRKNVPDDVTLWYRSIPEEDRDGHYTSPLRTVIDCLRDTSEPHGLAVLEHAVTLGMVGIDDVTTRVKALRGPGSGKARKVLSWYDPRPQPPVESALRAILLTGGIWKSRQATGTLRGLTLAIRAPASCSKPTATAGTAHRRSSPRTRSGTTSSSRADTAS